MCPFGLDKSKKISSFKYKFLIKRILKYVPTNRALDPPIMSNLIIYLPLKKLKWETENYDDHSFSSFICII